MKKQPMLFSATHTTPIGELTLIASDRGLRAILWPGEAPRRARVSGRPRSKPDHPVLRAAVSQLQEYFAGTRTGFDLPLDLEGTRFQVAAWRALADIPFGTTTSYGRQAAALGVPTAARAIGAANGANPVCIILPCHRVVAADGALGGFAAGLQVKRWLLDHEAGVIARQADDSLPRGRGRVREGAADAARSIVPEIPWQRREQQPLRLSMPGA